MITSESPVLNESSCPLVPQKPTLMGAEDEMLGPQRPLGSDRQPRSLSCQRGSSLSQANVGLLGHSFGWPHPESNGGGQKLCPTVLWVLGIPTQAWTWPGTRSWA